MAWLGEAWLGKAVQGVVSLAGILTKTRYQPKGKNNLSKGVAHMATKKNQDVFEAENLTITTPRLYSVTIKGTGGLLFNKMKDLCEKKDKVNKAKEDKLEKERATWREKLYYDDEGNTFIPGENFHQCLKEGTQYWGQKIAGEGNKTYTDVIVKSLVVEDSYLSLKKDSTAFVPFGKNCNGNPSKGKKSGCKVYKIRPLLMPWECTFVFHVFDARLTVPILQTILNYAGTFAGLGDWRPVYGRFEIVRFEAIGR